MIKLAVIDPGAEDIAGKIVAGLKEYGIPENDVGVSWFKSQAAMHGFCPDVVILSADAVSGKSTRDAYAERVACGIALLPGDAARDMPEAAAINLDTGCLVTYGMSPKNTLTYSSIGENTCVLALQRELLTVGGDVLERQEIRVRGGVKPETLLAVVGALLICGVRLPDINR